MLKFIDENDFNLVEKWELNEEGTYQWWYLNHNGVIWTNLTRTTIVEGEEVVLDIWQILQDKIEDGSVVIEPQEDIE